jgi:RHS repeat-associated protein
VTAEFDYAYDSRDRIQTDGIDAYAFDADGRMTSRSGADGFTLGWNSEDRLTVIERADGSRVIHAYDADGVLMSEAVTASTGATTTQFLVDDLGCDVSHVVAEVDEPTNDVLARYVRAGGRLLALLLPGETRYFHSDHISSVRQLTEKAGALTDSYDYDPFGVLLVHHGTSANLYLFAGQRFDAQRQLSQNRARWMAPSTGAFLSIDPRPGVARRPASLSRYAYAEGNPISNGDPTGESTLVEQSVVLAISALLIAVTIGQAINKPPPNGGDDRGDLGCFAARNLCWACCDINWIWNVTLDRGSTVTNAANIQVECKYQCTYGYLACLAGGHEAARRTAYCWPGGTQKPPPPGLPLP